MGSELSVVGTSLTSSEEHYAFIQALSHDRPRTYHAHTPGFLAAGPDASADQGHRRIWRSTEELTSLEVAAILGWGGWGGWGHDTTCGLLAVRAQHLASSVPKDYGVVWLCWSAAWKVCWFKRQSSVSAEVHAVPIWSEAEG